jgi:hypothetical protein
LLRLRGLRRPVRGHPLPVEFHPACARTPIANPSQSSVVIKTNFATNNNFAADFMWSSLTQKFPKHRPGICIPREENESVVSD